MDRVDPLSETELALWRALMRIVMRLPGRLDSDLVPAMAITANEYLTLMSLSGASERELRMTDLATATSLSASRMTRLVDELRSRGMVTKRASPEDGRGNVACLTPAGLAKLEAAWAAHLSSVRALVFDQVDSATVKTAARALSAIAARVEGTCGEADVRMQ